MLAEIDRLRAAGNAGAAAELARRFLGDGMSRVTIHRLLPSETVEGRRWIVVAAPGRLRKSRRGLAFTPARALSPPWSAASSRGVVLRQADSSC